MATNLPSCFSFQFLEQLLKLLLNFTLLKYVKSQRSYGFLITKELIFGFQILDLKDHFSAALSRGSYFWQSNYNWVADRRNMPVEDLIMSQLQSEKKFTDERFSHFKL